MRILQTSTWHRWKISLQEKSWSLYWTGEEKSEMTLNLCCLYLEGWKWLVWFETCGKWDKLSWKQATWHQWKIYWLFLSISKGLINFCDSFLEEHFKCLWRRAKRSDMDRDHSPLSAKWHFWSAVLRSVALAASIYFSIYGGSGIGDAE